MVLENVIIILGIWIVLLVGYYFYTRNSLIVRIDKNQVMEFKSSMELTGLPIITFYQGKTKYNFLLDTGSNVSYINNNANIKVRKIGANSTYIGVDGGDRTCELAIVELYRDSVVYECSINVADLDAAFTELKNNYGVTISGILGNDFFTKYKYCLDFKELVAYIRK